ncbi:uncharacterized protein PpBr36_05649 [Pyricularia pennisetigena]|uniref:uncharacterized protein n=1 Tax=Pyricularia pennisetigena TaxID=1578925 RepID=UPI001150511C|nr:uncharacterized protein PpBr36_05649 [Pyricularia pennisetigena]TLS23469.1 hypothetical protein PpBr36_05649 [Pyricularia pennisetigena]
MLRRHSSKSRPDIKQRKSTSPTRPGGVHLEHIEVEDARRDAHAAATEAFVRSQQRNKVADAPLFPDSVPRRANSIREGLRRQQSVRFVPDRDDGSDIERTGSHQSDMRGGLGPSRGGKERGEVRNKENMRPPHEGDMVPSSDEPFVSDLTSKLGLRRSKSMISGAGELGPARPERTSSIKCSSQARVQIRSDSPQSSSARRSNETNDTSALSLRAPKSMSFLPSSRRENSQNDSVISMASSHKETANHAEAPSIYSQRTTISGRLRVAPSMLFRSGSIRSIGSGRRSMRMSMRDGPDESIQSAIIRAEIGSRRSRNSSLTGKARRASQTLKSRIKTLFGRRSKDHGKAVGVEAFEKATEAEQQQDAASNAAGSVRTSLSLGVRSMQEEGTLSQVSSRVPTVQTVVQEQLIRSRKGSLASLQSECRMTASDDISRATSWGSTGHSTVASQQQAWSDWQQQRLSVITENAAGVASVSSPGDRHTLSAEPAEDRRVYSALAKRLAERQKLAEAGSKASDDTSGTHNGRENRAEMSVNSIYSTVGEPEGGTIRCVTASTETLEHCQTTAPVTSKLDSSAKVANRWTASISSLESAASETKPKRHESRCSTPDLPSLGMPRSNRSSAFFGSPTCYLFRTTSPYRRALKESNKAALAAAAAAAHGVQPSPLARSVESLKLPSSIMSGQPWNVDENAEYSESVYSGDENNDQSNISGSDTAREAVNGDDESGKVSKTAPHLSRRNMATSSESIDWKTWLAANVSKLEMQPSPVHSNEPVSSYFGHSAQGHRREATQIYDDADYAHADEDDNKPLTEHDKSVHAEQTTAADEKQTTPLGEVQHNATRAPSYHGQATSSKLAENQAPRTPTRAKSGLARARSLYRTRTSGDGSPCRPQAPVSVKLVRRRTAAVDAASPEKSGLDDMAQQTAAKSGVRHEKTTATASRRMVDLFLSSRRRRMTSSKDAGDAFV